MTAARSAGPGALAEPHEDVDLRCAWALGGLLPGPAAAAVSVVAALEHVAGASGKGRPSPHAAHRDAAPAD